MTEIEAAKEIHKDDENIIPSEKQPRYDQNFLLQVQTDSTVPADVLSQVVGLFDTAGIAARISFVGTIDYEAVF
jgi:hypothetical protein